MPSPSKSQLSPTELAQLEHAFATDPNSEAYLALGEAYLGLGRFMEAMVVCKKGIKAHPDRATPRVLLARVYAEQGKDRKALEELEVAIGSSPTDVAALRLSASLLLKAGDNDKGREYAVRAFRADPKDPETKDLLDKWKIEAAPPAPPPPAVVEMPAMIPATGPNSLPEGFLPQSTQPNGPAFANGHPAAAGMYANNGQAVAQNGYPAGGVPLGMPGGPDDATQPRTGGRQAKAPRAAPSAPARRPIDLSKFEEPAEPVRKSSGGGAIFLGFLVLAAACLVGYYLYSKAVKDRRAAIAEALHECGEELRNDSYASYKKATESAEKVLKLDPDSIAGHSYLTYIYAIRWGEHGEGDTAKNQALDHLAKAEKLHLDHSHLLAGQALVQFFNGQAPQAQSDLEVKMKDLESKGKISALLYETLGIIQMRNGDLEKASVSLKKALDLAPAEPRIHAAMGDLYRRQGQEINAWNYYDNALRYEHDHADAVLGKTLLVLEAEHPNYQIAEDLLKRVRDADPPPSPREQAMAFLLDGIRLNQIGKKAEGLQQEQKAIALDRNNPEIYVLQGRRMIKDGQLEQGLAAIKQAIALDPKRASFYVELARAQMATPNGSKDAINSLNTALKTLPNSAKLLGLLGEAQHKSGDPAAAKATLEKALAVDPTAKLPDIRLSLAGMYRTDKAYPKATEFYERAALEFAGTNNKVAEVYDDEAQMMEEQGADPNKILEEYSKALNADTEYAPSYYFVGKFLSGNKKAKDKAKDSLDEYLKRDKSGPYAASATQILATLK